MSTARWPTRDVTPVSIRYIHPPYHGYADVTVMVMYDQLKSISFHVNQPSHSWNKTLKRRPWSLKVKVMHVVKGQGQTVGPVSTWFGFFSFHTNQIFHVNRNNYSWDMSNRVFDPENRHPKFEQQNKTKQNKQTNKQKTSAKKNFPKSNQVISMPKRITLPSFELIGWVVLTLSCIHSIFIIRKQIEK